MGLIVEAAIEGSLYERSTFSQPCLGLVDRQEDMEIVQACSGSAAKRAREMTCRYGAISRDRVDIGLEGVATGQHHRGLLDEPIPGGRMRRTRQQRVGRPQHELRGKSPALVIQRLEPMNHAGRHDDRLAFGDFATARLESKPRSTGKQPHDFVAGMEMGPETPGRLSALDDFQRPSSGLVDRQEGSGCARGPIQGLISCRTGQHRTA
jgi:hypothetical protein